MIPVATLTSKGQITRPKEIRKALHLTQTDKVAMVAEEGSEVIEKISILTNTPNLNIPNSGIIAEALIVYSMKNIDYIDAYNAVFMRHHSTSEIYSYDGDFDSIGGIKRIEL